MKLTKTETALLERMKANRGALTVVLGPGPGPRAWRRRSSPGQREFDAMRKLVAHGLAEEIGRSQSRDHVRGPTSRIGTFTTLTAALTPTGWAEAG